MHVNELLEMLEIQNLNEYRPDPGTHLVLVTGRMALPGLKRMMSAIDPKDFTYEIRVLNIEIAAWLTAEKIIEEFGSTKGVDLILIPGKTIGSEETIEDSLKVKVMRGPGCYSEMPIFLEETGIEPDVGGVPRPKVLILGDEAGRFAEFVAKTYEVPFVTIDKLIARAEEDGLTVDDPYKHNFLAELVRSRLIEEDAKQGFVLLNYPRTARDYIWFVEMNIRPDKILVAGKINEELEQKLTEFMGYTQIPSNADDREMQVFALKTIEETMQQCVVPDLGYADREK